MVCPEYECVELEVEGKGSEVHVERESGDAIAPYICTGFWLKQAIKVE